MGSLQALEAIKIVSRRGDVLSRRMLVYDALSGRFMTVKLRGRNPSCAACGDSPTVTAATLPTYSYTGFTGVCVCKRAPCFGGGTGGKEENCNVSVLVEGSVFIYHWPLLRHRPGSAGWPPDTPDNYP